MRPRPALLLILCLLLSSCWFSATVHGESRALVRYVIDGDTIVLSNGIKVRYLGINCPEIPHEDQPGEPLGRAAQKRNRALVKGKVVRLEYGPEKRDRFGRLLAYVFLPGGAFVNEILVREGLAHVCFRDRNLSLNKRLLGAQRRAIKDKRGIWSIRSERPEPYYVGNKKSLRFHRPSCSYGKKIWKRNRVIFKTRREAAWEGYCPCKKCRP